MYVLSHSSLYHSCTVGVVSSCSMCPTTCGNMLHAYVGYGAQPHTWMLLYTYRPLLIAACVCASFAPPVSPWRAAPLHWHLLGCNCIRTGIRCLTAQPNSAAARSWTATSTAAIGKREEPSIFPQRNSQPPPAAETALSRLCPVASTAPHPHCTSRSCTRDAMQ